ncbi:D-sedoheptulose 7-phosphate isomerase [Streptosporangium lutulentum]|uniref:D-sedoheptulose 7-phosphate isomerase n=2 Tax=Streptosporangium lutulentum TaxID=1461250 RepID=A0ABT9QTP3_9ACTN|nr:D-sedoheptulose 7-phosphate isomerase [Streptosporangium lutulentum]
MKPAVCEAFARRDSAGRALADDAERIARACQEMAVLFHLGGKLIVFGNGGGGTDAAHIAVEFMHPVIVGKRALPAVALSNDAATVSGVGNDEGLAEVFAHQVRHWADTSDMALGISRDGRCANVLRGLETAKDRGLFTLALVGGDGGAVARSQAVDHVLVAASDDPAVVKEIHVTVYHLLWELVHVFFDQAGPLSDRAAG